MVFSVPAPSGGGFSLSSTANPAPAAGGFSFASPAPAKGNSTPTPAFGAASAAPSTSSAFGAASAPASGAPAPAFGSFAATPAPASGAPAPAFGTFAATPAPSTTGSLFGGATPAPAPAFGAAFRTPAPGTTFGPPAPAPGGLFQSNTTPAAPGSAPMMLTGQTPYASLPPNAKAQIDALYEKIMSHRRTIIQVRTMAPALLREKSTETSVSSPADVAAGVSNSVSTPLPTQLKTLQRKVQEVKHKLDQCRKDALSLRKMYETSAIQAVMYGTWPIEALAVRRGVKLTALETKADPVVRNDLKVLLDKGAASVDRVERVPSPYMWEILQDFETRLSQFQQSIESLYSHLEHSQMADMNSSSSDDVSTVVHVQSHAIWRVANAVTQLHGQMDQVRIHYRRHERGENVLDKADVEEAERELRIEQQMRVQYVKAAPSGSSQPAGVPARTSTAPTITGAFGSTKAPAPGGLFGSSPAPASGSLFGTPTTQAPAPTGSLFGSTTAPAPAAGPFGPSPAPAPGGGLFGNPPTPGAFGTAPAPAPGGLFGSGTPAPAPGPFGTSSLASTPKSKSKSRSGRRR